MANAAGIVAMGGYNTFCEILSFDSPAILIPRIAPRREQLLRATRAAELGLTRMLDIDSGNDPAVMAAALRDLPQQPRPSTHGSAGLLRGLEVHREARLAAPARAPPQAAAGTSRLGWRAASCSGSSTCWAAGTSRGCVGSRRRWRSAVRTSSSSPGACPCPRGCPRGRQWCSSRRCGPRTPRSPRSSTSRAAPDDAYLARRTQALIEAFEAARPDVVVLETYPFGRRALRFELEPLLARVAATQPRPRVVASVRDLLQRRNDDARDRCRLEVARRCVDEILVHGDPAFARLEETFPPAADAACPSPTPATCVRRSRLRHGRSGAPRGGRAAAAAVPAGEALLAAALDARALSALREATVARPGRHPDAEGAIRCAGGRRAALRRRRRATRDDFASLLRGPPSSVSQAGYNTVLDVLLPARRRAGPVRGRGRDRAAHARASGWPGSAAPR